ncbi:signal peptide peptidase-like 2B [Ixodes scapularis]|uniref:signal peptide peptidase-like 2B n=1 Tax=Ixodes scapularis TaxID=6945 RepID=UPI001AD7C104|nr:signal peptide peptidase-like 2B [Ixodes scapularis]
MVEVAKGGKSTEQLPMILKFPRLNRYKYKQCFPLKFSILGLGDILAPGLLISFCHAFDLLALGKRFYYYVACVAYGVGMVITFLALHLMHIAQPALLYLVPCTVVAVVVLAWYKGHLYAMWNGVRLESVPVKPAKQPAVSSQTRAPEERPFREPSPEDSETELIPDRPTENTSESNKKSRKGRKESGQSDDKGDNAPKAEVPSPGVDGTSPTDAVFACAGDDVLAEVKPRTTSPETLPIDSLDPDAAVTVRKRISHTSALSWEEQLSHFILGQGGSSSARAETAPAVSPFPA